MATCSTSSTSSQEDIHAFLRSIYPPSLFSSLCTTSETDPPIGSSAAPPPSCASPRPFVTLTYAQSLDGKIAGPGGAQIRLSGTESMRLTHGLRELHDSILVGIGTLLSDDPQLNARLPTLLPIRSQPRPIVFDSQLRAPTTAKLLQNFRAGTMPQTTLCCAEEADPTKRNALEEAGGRVQVLQRDAESRLSISALLERRELVGRSLMVEGGASIISAFLESGLVDLLIITVAPKFVGPGISAVHEGKIPPELEHVETKVFGPDAVIVARPRARS